jgi:predicted metal-dependent peptidase
MTEPTGPRSELHTFVSYYRREFPVLTPALNRLKFEYIGESDKLITFNGKTVGVSAELLSWSTSHIFVVFTHEVMHYMFHHVGRFRAYSLTEKTKKAANLAMDLMANRCIEGIDEKDRLKKTLPNGTSVLDFPEGMLTIEKVVKPNDLEELEKGLTAEKLYKYILERFEELEEQMDNDPTAGDLVVDDESPDLNGAEATISKNIWDAVSRGTSSSSNLRNKGDYPEVTIDYRRELKDFMLTNLANSQISTFTRLSRRTLGQIGMGENPPIQPGTIPEKAIRLACVAVDTSASIDDKLLNELMANVSEIQQQTGCRLYLIFCDYSITTEYEVEAEDNLLDLVKSGFIQIKGGGGTSFIPAQDRMLNLGRKGIDDMDVGIYLTDGYGDWLRQEDFPLYNRLMWILTPDNNWLNEEGNPTGNGPDYGKMLVLKRSEE